MSFMEVTELFDFFWFEKQVFGNTTTKPSSSNPVPVSHDMHEELKGPPLMKLSQTPSFILRSFSETALSSKDVLTDDLSSSDPPSPKFVLFVPMLETMLSGKEIGGFSLELPASKNIVNKGGFDDVKMKRESIAEGGKDRRRRKGSRSLSELEFEELKGFMDLGFVFSDESDKDSSLVSIVPGLQRFGRKVDEHTVSRPYLSEAWDVLDENKAQKDKVKNQLMNWKIPATGTDLEIKDQLRFWAHTVASTVR